MTLLRCLGVGLLAMLAGMSSPMAAESVAPCEVWSPRADLDPSACGPAPGAHSDLAASGRRCPERPEQAPDGYG